MRRSKTDYRRPRFANIYGDTDYTPKFYIHMFQEDAAIGLMPFRSELSHHPNISVTLTAPDLLRSQALDLLRSINGEDWYNNAEIVRATVERIGQLLVWGGRIRFEIITGHKELGPALHNFSERLVFRVPFGFVQVVPRTQRIFGKQSWAWLSSSAVWTVSLPESLGGWREHRRMLRVLSRLRETGPDFFRRDLEDRKLPAEYDSKIYHRAVKIAVFRATRIWGWIARDWQDDETTEYYKFDRTLTQHWAKATLRTHIVAELNAFLARVLPGCNIGVAGMPSPDDVLAVQQKMRRGELDFAAAMAAVDPLRA